MLMSSLLDRLGILQSCSLSSVQTEAERIALENSDNLNTDLRETLIASAYSRDDVARMTIDVRSEEKHKIYTWLNR